MSRSSLSDSTLASSATSRVLVTVALSLMAALGLVLGVSGVATAPAAAFRFLAAASATVGATGTKTAPSFVSREGVSPCREGSNSLRAWAGARGEVVSRAVSVSVGRAESGGGRRHWSCGYYRPRFLEGCYSRVDFLTQPELREIPAVSHLSPGGVPFLIGGSARRRAVPPD